MLKIIVAIGLAWLCAGCAGMADGSSGASTGSSGITMYGVLDEGVSVRK
jgi:hypothetical protein